MLRQKILTWLLPKLLSQEVPKYIPRTGEQGKAINLYVIKLSNKKGKEEHLIDSIDLKENKLLVRSLNDVKKEFSIKNSIDIIGLQEYILDITHYLGLHEFNYRNIYYVFLSYITSLDKIRAKFDVFSNHLSNFYHNKKGTFTKGRMNILNSMLELQLNRKDVLGGKYKGISEFDLMSAIYTDKWILSPFALQIRKKFQLYLESLKSSDDIGETDGYYVVKGKGLKTLEEDEREERTHTDAKRGRKRIFWLTLIIAFSALVQANLISLPPISQWPSRIIAYLDSAQTIILPKPTGPYAIGTKSIEVDDSSRSMLRGASSRRWMVQLFYPTKVHKGTYPYMPGTLKDGEVNDVLVKAHAKPDALPLSTQQLPLVVFIPGRGGIRQQYTILLEELASHGYVVISMDQPYVSSFVTFPNGDSITLTLKDVWKVPRDRDYRYQYDDEVIAGAIKDIAYLLNHQLDLGSFEKIIDSSNIILMGHSLGANIAHVMGFQDKRIQAIIDIDSKITERKVFGNVGIPPNPRNTPIFFIRGNKQYQDDVGDQLLKTQHATLWSPDVEHSTFSDNVYFSAKIKDFGAQGFIKNLINWLLKLGPHWDKVDTNIGELKADEWISEYRKRVIDWLKTLEKQNTLSESEK